MITLFGAPGAGKTLQGQLLAKEYNWRWVSYRDLLLSLNDKDIKFAVEHGLFIDDKKATSLIRRTFVDLHDFERGIFKSDWTKGGSTRQVILDGFPGDYRQLKWLIDNKELKSLKGAIVLRVPRGELWRRLVERKRVDDTRATIERRQDMYDRNITGMIRTLTMNGVLVREVDGGNSPQDVLARIKDVLSDWGLAPEKEYQKIDKPPIIRVISKN